MNEAAVLKRPIAQLAPRHALREVILFGEEVTYRALPGEGAPLFAIHGLGSDGRDLLDLCEQVGHPTVLIDLPGFGASARPERAYTVRRAAEVCLALLNHLGWVRPIWLGASYGAHVALRAALDSPARVERLVLLSAGGLDPDPPAALAGALPRGAPRGALAGGAGGDAGDPGETKHSGDRGLRLASSGSPRCAGGAREERPEGCRPLGSRSPARRRPEAAGRDLPAHRARPRHGGPLGLHVGGRSRRQAAASRSTPPSLRPRAPALAGVTR